MSAVSCVAWVKQGGAKKRPDRINVAEDDLKKIIDTQSKKLQDLELQEEEYSDDDSDNKRKRKTPKAKDASGPSNAAKKEEKEDAAAEMEASDSENDEDFFEDEDDAGVLGMGNIAYHGSSKDDPYIDKDLKHDSDDEDLQVLPDDNLIAVGKISGDFCNLEVYLYNEKNDDLYCHHDVLLPSLPLCLEWLDFDPGESAPGNLVAMGTMLPDIEIWDLDVIDALEPAFVLQGAELKVGKKKKKKTSVTGHSDAVLDLSWNRIQRKVLASASADSTVGIWDLEQGLMATSLKEHTDKVQCVQWHPVEAQTLLSGSFDSTVRVYDCQSSGQSQKSWKLNGEIERVLWNFNNPFQFLASTDIGFVYEVDVRQSKPLHTLKAHDAGVTGLTLSSSIPGCLVTTSADKLLKVWDIRGDAPVEVLKKPMKMGELHCVASSPDSPLVFSVGGVTEFRVLNLQKNREVCQCFNVTRKEPSGKGRQRKDYDDDAVNLDESEDELSDMEADMDEEVGAAVEEAAKAEPKKKKKKKKKKAKAKVASEAN